jgi:hypothetical protein
VRRPLARDAALMQSRQVARRGSKRSRGRSSPHRTHRLTRSPGDETDRDRCRLQCTDRGRRRSRPAQSCSSSTASRAPGLFGGRGRRRVGGASAHRWRNTLAAPRRGSRSRVGRARRCARGIATGLGDAMRRRCASASVSLRDPGRSGRALGPLGRACTMGGGHLGRRVGAETPRAACFLGTRDTSSSAASPRRNNGSGKH